MANKSQSKLVFSIKVAFIGVSIPLLFSQPGWAKECTQTEIRSKIEQFQDAKNAKAAIDAVVRCKSDAIAPLKQALSDNESAVRANAATTLGKMGAIARDATPSLSAALGDSDEMVRTESASALIQIGRAVQSQEDSPWDAEAVKNLKTLQGNVADALKKLEADKRDWASKKKDIETLSRVNNGLQSKLNDLEENQTYQIVQWLKSNPWVWIALGYAGGYLSIFTFHPTLLLKLDSWVKPASFTIPWLNLPVSLGNVLVLKYHPRVLNAWVEQRIATAQDRFIKKRKTVSDREIHLAQPVLLERSQKDFKPEEFRDIFKQREVRLVIWGEGGGGKTSLACQIAKWAMADKKADRLCQHRMLPILIEEELDKPLLETVGGLLKDLAQEGQPIPEELLKALLEKKQLLVIADHLSEMGQKTREQIQPSRDSKFPVNALVVTSRIKDILGSESAPAFLQPCRIPTGGLAGFLNEYLVTRQVASLFDDLDYSTAYRCLGKIESGRQTGESSNSQGVTILLVKLYAEQMIAAKQGILTDELPDNVPDLMLQYLNELNRNVTQDKLENAEVHQFAQAIAWKCIEPTFKPESADCDAVLQTLRELVQDSPEKQEGIAKQRLKYLIKQMSLIRLREPGQTLRFALDPLTEYLAGLYLVQKYQGKEEVWRQEIFDKLEDKPGFPEEIRGFLLALRDCCEEKGKKYSVPVWVAEKLGEKAGLDLVAIQQAQQKRRVRILSEELGAPEAKFRRQAMENLEEIANEDKNIVKSAVPRLQRMLENDGEEPKLRLSASLLLSQLKEDILMLTAKIEEEKITLRLVEPPPTIVEDLGDGAYLEMVSIPAGSFMMGSPENELERTSNESPQHRVSIPTFFIGKYQVTQAQWKAVAALTKVKIALNPDPSSFKGDRLPVESVSWLDAQEFCRRLSKKTGKDYRLPSEAEWEYACRAGTTTTFHFGETITPELANYNGNHPYGDATKGEYREKTTPVGSFPANAFGLYDMHGNVWEWCADDWLYNYEGAPTDGSICKGDIKNYEAAKSVKLLRGGSWLGHAQHCRSAYRTGNDADNRNHNNGFRVVCVLR